MRKLFAIIVSIALISTHVDSALAASSYDDPQKVAAGTVLTLGTAVSYDFPSGTTFKPGDDFGKDLYNKVRLKVRSKGSDLAVARTLTNRPLSKEELAIMIPGSNINEFLSRDPGDKLSPQAPITRRQQLIQDLAEEKELADLQVQAEMDIEPLEIFSNGDVSDSGFDLLADLDLIETILFGKPDTALSNAGPGAPAGANVIGGNIGNPGSGGGANIGGAGQNNGGNGGAGQGGGSGGAGANGGQGGGSGGAGGGASNGGTATGVVCPVNPAFNSAVLDAIKDQAAQNNGGANNGGAGNGNGNNNGNGAGQNQNGGNGNQGGAGQNNGNGNNNSGGAGNPKADDWGRPNICNDVFCLKFEAVYKKASSYQSTDNCIACHFEKINEAFKKTIDKNLTPSKQTGNIGEGPKCKRSMLNLKWNLVLIPQPILTPPNDDLVVKGDFAKNITEFIEKYYSNPGRCKDGEAGGSCKPDSGVAEIAQREIENAVPGETQEEKVANIARQLAEAHEKARQLIEAARLESNAVSQAGQYQVLLQEMDTMNTFFKSYVDIFNAIAPGGKGSPCDELLAKGQCQ